VLELASEYERLANELFRSETRDETARCRFQAEELRAFVALLGERDARSAILAVATARATPRPGKGHGARERLG
jgi:hypothetical protein